MVDQEYNIILNVKAMQTVSEIMMAITLIRSFTRMLKRMGLPDDVTQLVNTIIRIITWLRMLYAIMQQLQAMIAGGGSPWGLLMTMFAYMGYTSTVMNTRRR